jgi:hypothetical protein
VINLSLSAFASSSIGDSCLESTTARPPWNHGLTAEDSQDQQGLPGSPRRPARKRDSKVLYIERGLKVFARARTCLVVGENAGEWLLSFAPRDWLEVFVMAKSSDEWIKLAGQSLRKLTFVAENSINEVLKHCDVLLGGGSWEALSNVLTTVSTVKPVLLVTSGEGARRLAFSQLRRVSHYAVGGVILHGRVLFGFAIGK